MAGLIDYALTAGLGDRRNATNINPAAGQTVSSLIDNGMKGKGFFGPLINNDGHPMTEYSADMVVGGKTVQFPLLVPTLSPDEIDLILSGRDLTDEEYQPIFIKARQFAMDRMLQGKSPFAGNDEAFELPVSQD